MTERRPLQRTSRFNNPLDVIDYSLSIPQDQRVPLVRTNRFAGPQDVINYSLSSSTSSSTSPSTSTSTSTLRPASMLPPALSSSSTSTLRPASMLPPALSSSSTSTLRPASMLPPVLSASASSRQSPSFSLSTSSSSSSSSSRPQLKRTQNSSAVNYRVSSSSSSLAPLPATDGGIINFRTSPDPMSLSNTPMSTSAVEPMRKKQKLFEMDPGVNIKKSLSPNDLQLLQKYYTPRDPSQLQAPVRPLNFSSLKSVIPEKKEPDYEAKLLLAYLNNSKLQGAALEAYQNEIRPIIRDHARDIKSIMSLKIRPEYKDAALKPIKINFEQEIKAIAKKYEINSFPF